MRLTKKFQTEQVTAPLLAKTTANILITCDNCEVAAHTLNNQQTEHPPGVFDEN